MGFTAKEIEDYLAHPNHCPKCGSDNIGAGTLQSEHKTAWCNVACKDCGTEWQDVYTLTTIDKPA